MPLFWLSGALILLSQSANWIRLADAHAAVIGFWRMALSCLFLGALMAWKGGFRLRRGQFPWLLLCGIFLFLHFYTWFLSVQKTTVANSMILFCSNPVFTALGAWLFFRERMQWRYGVALGLCLVGLGVLLKDSLGFQAERWEGDLLGLVCAVLFSGYVLVSKRLRSEMENVPFAFYTYLVCVAFFAVGVGWERQNWFHYSEDTWLGVWGLTIGSTLLGHFVFTWCLKYLNVNFMSTATLVEPAMSAWTASIFWGEPLTRGAVWGFVLVAAGVIVLYLPFWLDVWKGNRGAYLK